MRQQPEPSSSMLAVSLAPMSGPASDPAPDPASASENSVRPPHQVPRWLVRVESFLWVVVRLCIGLFLVYAPWVSALWDQNPLFRPIFLEYPKLANIASTGAVRGLVTGLGLLNLWFVFYDAIRRRDG